MRIFAGGIGTETNTFAALPTGRGDFEALGLGRRGAPPPAELAGLVELLQTLAAADGVVLERGLIAIAMPSGPTIRRVYDELRAELLADLRTAAPVHAVVLLLHGAMVAEDLDDCEGDLLEQVRAQVGPQVPIGALLDPHCHFTERMRRHADVLVAYKHYPHTDIDERLREVWRLTLACARGALRPVTEAFDCRMVGQWPTMREPGAGLVRRMQAMESEPGVLSVNFGHGFPYGDVPEAGARTWVTTDGRRDLAARLARELAHEVWRTRDALQLPRLGVAEAVDRLRATAPGPRPLVLADTADNAGGGAASDSTFLLRAVHDAGLGDIVFGAFWDLGAVRICHDAGVGAHLPLRVGGKCGPASGDPVDLQVTVRGLRDAHAQTGFGGVPNPCGPSAWVGTDDGLELVLVSLRQQVLGTDLFTGLGLPLAPRRAIVVKSSQHFHAAFAPLASEVLYVATPGLLRDDFEALPYRRRSLDYWPRMRDPWHGQDPF